MTLESTTPTPRASEPGPEALEDRSRTGGEGRSDRRFLGGLLKLMRPRLSSVVREELTQALAEPDTGEGAFSPEERAMLNNILRLRGVRVEDIMVPRADIKAVEIGATLAELMRQFELSGHSRLPVYGESLDDPRGMIHIRDVLSHFAKAPRRPARPEVEGAAPLDLRQINLSRRIADLGIVRKVLFVPPSMLAGNLMAKMQATRTQMALVIDEYGGTDGLVSFEDVIEMVVGNIEDEHDDDEAVKIVERGEGVFYADARADLDDVRAVVGEDFDIAAYQEEADTVGGLLFSELGRVPARGEVIQAVPGFEFQVLEADPRRVRRVRIVRLRQGEKRRRIVQDLAATQ